MKITDPIADMFTRIRNAVLAGHDKVVIPYSGMKLSILKILKNEGFIKYFELLNEDLKKKNIKVGLSTTPDGKSVISKIERVSTPGNSGTVEILEGMEVLEGIDVRKLWKFWTCWRFGMLEAWKSWKSRWCWNS